MDGEFFEWDEVKPSANLTKHRVSFETASLVFQDPFSIDEADIDSSIAEDRFNIIGQVDGRTLFVAYAMNGDRIRIISARGAVHHERRRYSEEGR